MLELRERKATGHARHGVDILEVLGVVGGIAQFQHGPDEPRPKEPKAMVPPIHLYKINSVIDCSGEPMHQMSGTDID